MYTKTRLIRRKITVSEMDSVKSRQDRIGRERDVQLLERCNALWENLRDFRIRGARANRYAYGDQWGDSINVNGTVMTQRQYLQSTGNVVLQTNQIKSKVDSIVGVMVNEKNEPICKARDRAEQQYGEIVTTALQANCDKNKMNELYILFLKDICLRGLAIAYESYDDYSGPDRRLDSWTRYVNPNMVFLDSQMTDPRFWDMTIIGQFFDITFEELVSRFARNERDYAILKDLYASQSVMFREEADMELSEKNDEDNLVFNQPYDNTKCRVFEVWTKETKARIRLHDTNEGTIEIIDANDYDYRRRVKEENESRRAAAKDAGWPEEDTPYITGDGFGVGEEKNGFFIDTFWYCRYLAPDGTILWEGESPYAGRSHPFTIMAIPFVDGKISGYMNDAIDHNTAMNRAIILNDWLVRSQAKGVTVVPKGIVPKDMSLEDFSRSWTAIDDLVYIDMKPGQEGLMPKVFTGVAQSFNVSELLNTYSKLMDNSTAVSGALQGRTPAAGTSGTLYAQMTNNASIPIASLLEQFRGFLQDVSTKKMKNIILFYDTPRFESIAGDIGGVLDNGNLNLNEIGDIEFDLSIKASTSTPVYRAIINDDAKQFLIAGLITFEEYLEIADVPYADKILQMRQARQAETEDAQQAGIMPGGEPSLQEAQPSPAVPV